MDVEPIRQLNLGSITAQRFGEEISSSLEDEEYTEFLFCVAYMRESGLNRLSPAITSFQKRGGTIHGAIGVDSGVTTVEALEALQDVSPASTVFSTVTNLIFHPKLYIFKGDSQARVIVGSANLTRDGLFRNVEFGTKLIFDLDDRDEKETFGSYEEFVLELLDDSKPNVHQITTDLLNKLEENDLIASASDTWAEGSESRTYTKSTDEARELFPSISVDSPPPSTPVSPTSESKPDEATSFVMQLSSSDCSHRTGTAGTPMILIPKDAIGFFPDLKSGGSTKHPDAFFDVRLNTSDGPEKHTYRFWYYADKEEYRFRVDNETIDLTTPGGGDLMVVTKLDDEPALEYEVSFVNPEDPRFDGLLASCEYSAGGKKWGMIS